jgi:hypothetical protein
VNRTSRRTAVAATAVVAALLGAPLGAAAQQTSLPDWKLGAIVYGWFPSAVSRTSAPDLDAGAPLPSWRLTTGVAGLGFAGPGSATGGLSLRAPRSALALDRDAPAAGGVQPRNWTWSLLGSYALVTRPESQMELVGGARYLRLQTAPDGRFVGSTAAWPDAALGESTRESEAWDAVVGTRGRYRFGAGSRWFLPYYLDVGAGQSDLTWQAMGGIGYAFSWGEVFASYRHLDYRFGSDSRLKDLTFSGPAVGFGFRW